MVELLSDIFAARRSVLRQLDARVKLLVVVSAITAVVTSQTALFPLLILCTACVTTLASGVPLRYLVLRMAGPLGLVVVAVAIRAALTGTVPLFRLPLGSLTLTISSDGLVDGVLIGARVLGAVATVLLLGATTPAYHLLAALRWAKMPADWVDVALMMYRYIFQFAERAADIATAQRVRLGYGGWRRSMRSMGILAGAVITGSMEQVVRTADGMRVRGYTDRLPFAPARSLTRKDAACVVTAMAALWGMWIFCGQVGFA